MLFIVFAFFLVYFFVKKQQLLLELQNKELSVRFDERELMMTQVSKEVHDNIGQIVHLSRMHLHEIEISATNEYQLKLIRYVSELTDLLINNTNHISHSLNSDFIKTRGLARVLEDDLEQIKSSSNIACHLHVEGRNSFLEPEQKLIIYRIAQEAIRNSLRHAQASSLEISLYYTDTKFHMTIQDDGRGFDLAKAKEKGMLGLGNMNQRTKLLNGTLTIQTSETKGCMIRLSVGKL